MSDERIRQNIGFGDERITPPTRGSPSPWVMGITSSVVGAAVGWVIEEVATHIRKRRRR